MGGRAGKDPFEKTLREQTPLDLDPSRFNDPLAMKVEWHPIRMGGANFRTSRLVERSARRMEFRPTMAMALFGLFFMAASAFMAFMSVFVWGGLEDASTTELLFPFGMLGLFFTVGLGIIALSRRPIVFDKNLGMYYKRWKPPQSAERARVGTAARLREIHALQIVRELVSYKSTYYSYELNLVLKDGSRMNVIDHAKLKPLRTDAQRLAKFLDVDVWDATTVTFEEKIGFFS